MTDDPGIRPGGIRDRALQIVEARGPRVESLAAMQASQDYWRRVIATASREPVKKPVGEPLQKIMHVPDGGRASHEHDELGGAEEREIPRMGTLIKDRAEALRTQQPELDDAALTKRILALPEVVLLSNDPNVVEELRTQLCEDVIDRTCFVYGTPRQVIVDEELRRMSDQQLAAWCQKAGVMFAQVKAHLAARYPEMVLKVISGGKGE